MYIYISVSDLPYFLTTPHHSAPIPPIFCQPTHVYPISQQLVLDATRNQQRVNEGIQRGAEEP